MEFFASQASLRQPYTGKERDEAPKSALSLDESRLGIPGGSRHTARLS